MDKCIYRPEIDCIDSKNKHNKGWCIGCVFGEGQTMVTGQEDKFGRKNDQGKLRMDLIPPETEEALAEVLTYGATKYEDRNWEKGIKYSRVYAAMRRHLLAWMKGEKVDKEWGLLHLAHAYCCLAFLLTYEMRGMDKDWDDLHKEK